MASHLSVFQYDSQLSSALLDPLLISLTALSLSLLTKFINTQFRDRWETGATRHNGAFV